MAIEIERKFLVRFLPSERMSRGLITQGYLCKDPERTVRVRTTQSLYQEWSKSEMTVKGKSSDDGLSREEIEFQIDDEHAVALLRMCTETVVKERWQCAATVIVNGEVTRGGYGKPFNWEIDVFQGPLFGLVVAEIELPSKDIEVLLPEWIEKEVTGDPRYYNSQLVVNGIPAR